MHINSVKKSLNSINKIINNSSNKIKTGIVSAAMAILPTAYALGQTTNITNNNTQTTSANTDAKPIQSYQTIRPGQTVQIDLDIINKNPSYKNIKPVFLPYSSTQEFMDQFYGGLMQVNKDDSAAVDGITLNIMSTSIHPKINDDEWNRFNYEQTMFLSELLNNQGKDDPLGHLTLAENKKFFQMKRQGPNYQNYWIGVLVHYDAGEVLRGKVKEQIPMKDIPVVFFIDDVVNTEKKSPVKKQTEHANNTNEHPKDSLHSGVRAYLGVGLENIFDIKSPISTYQARLGLDFGAIRVGGIAGVGDPIMTQNITNKNIQGNGGTEEKYTSTFNITQYGAELGLDIKKFGFNLNYKLNEVKQTKSGIATQDVNAGHDNNGNPIDPHTVTYDLGTTTTVDNFKTWGAGLEYHFNKNISTAAEVSFRDTKPYAASLSLVYTIGKGKGHK